LYEKLPTNTTDTVWHWDPGSGRWNADPRITEKMEKVESFEVIVQPTPEHPAHVEVVRKDVAVGLWTTTLHSGMLSLADKRQRIERLNEVLRAVKVAIRSANDAEVVGVNVAEGLLRYIDTGTLIWE
jgi:hypothetical protein